MQRKLHLSAALSLLLMTPSVLVRSQGPTTPAKPSGVLRLRVRVKIGDATRGLARKRFYLVKGSLEDNKAVFDAAQLRPLDSRECYYSKLGASSQFIAWLKDGDCESVYCREVDEQFITGPKAVPEFAAAFAAGEKVFGAGEIGHRWVTNNLPPKLRDGFYQERHDSLTQLIKQAETLSGARVLTVMTDRNGTAYFTDLAPGTYVLTNFLPVEVGQMADSWNCEVQIKPGDIATERPYLVSNSKDRNVKCVAIEKPLPVCNQ